MKRYSVPRVAFVNKLDRQGSNPWKVINDLRNQLKLNAAAVQIPVGLENEHRGVIDLVEMVMYTFEGDHGEKVNSSPFPDDLQDMAEEKKLELIEKA